MSQPVLTATLAFVIAVTLTTALATVTSVDQRAIRAVRLTVVTASIAVAAVALEHARLRINFTGSMPIGMYLLEPTPADGDLPPGTLVAACAPRIAAELGKRRGYLAAGRCAAGTELLLKMIVAVSGDDVAISGNGVSVNECALPHSRQLALDAAGRRLSRWPEGRYRLRRHELWLYAANDRSWDSRYWGPVAVADVTARVAPLFTAPLPLREWQRCADADAVIDELLATNLAEDQAHGQRGLLLTLAVDRTLASPSRPFSTFL